MLQSKSKHKRNKSKDLTSDDTSKLTSEIQDLTIAGPRVAPVFDRDSYTLHTEREQRRMNRPVPIAPRASGKICCITNYYGSMDVVLKINFGTILL